MTAANSLEHDAICAALKENGADTTFNGHLEFEEESNNFWPPDQLIKQIQGDEWTVVWPEDRAAAELQGPAN